MSGSGLHDLRAIVFDLDGTLSAQRDFKLSGFDAKARSRQTVRMLTGELGALCASSTKAFDLTLARVVDLPACLPYQWVTGQ